MEIIRGKKSSFMDARELTEQIAEYEQIHIDIGTGDGRFVRHLAQRDRRSFVIGLDACRENLADISRRAPANTLFVIANALNIPTELYGMATQITIHFPWGSLLAGMVNHEPTLLDGIKSIAKPGAEIAIYLNSGAIQEAGFSLEEGSMRVRGGLATSGYYIRSVHKLGAKEIKICSTTWAKRLAFGRDPRAVYLSGVRR